MSTVANKPGEDPTLPDVKLIVGGMTYQLSYDFNAVVKAESATGINLLSAVVGDITATSLRGLLWAALLKDKPGITIEEAGRLILPSNIATVREAIVTAWFGSVSEKDDAEGEATAQE